MHTPDHPVSRDSWLIVHTRSTGGKKKATNPRRLFSAVESLSESLYRGNNPTKPCLVDTKAIKGRPVLAVIIGQQKGYLLGHLSSSARFTQQIVVDSKDV